MTIEERIERLERMNQRCETTNRFFRRLTMWIGIAAIPLTVAVASLWFWHFDTTWFRATGIEVLGNGDYSEDRVRLTSDSNGGRIVISNFRGRDVVVFAVDDRGNGLIAVYNALGNPTATLMVDENGSGVVGVLNRAGQSRTLVPGP